jgi:glutathione transport system ATP-binding protein
MTVPSSAFPTASSPATAQPLLSVRSLSVEFPVPGGRFRAVDGLSFDLQPGRTLAIVGESGSGKTVTSQAIMRLTDYSGGEIVDGEVLFNSPVTGLQDLRRAGDEQLRRIRGNEIAMIFQEPMTSLNPVFTVGNQIGETLMLHQGMSRGEAREHAVKLLELVRLPDARRLIDAYPHTLSGGMRQRAMIAMALACKPALLIADEPTTALDVTIQAQILNIIRELQRDLQTAVMFITHDMGVVAQMADDVVVMWRGRQVERGPVEQIFDAPQHPYTRALLSAVPRLGSLTGQPLPKRMPLTVLEDGELRQVGVEQVQDTVDARAPLLTVDRLTTRFDVGHTVLGRVTHRVHAVEQVSFDIHPGETLALVGESGSGKSTIGKTLQ